MSTVRSILIANALMCFAFSIGVAPDPEWKVILGIVGAVGIFLGIWEKEDI